MTIIKYQKGISDIYYAMHCKKKIIITKYFFFFLEPTPYTEEKL